MGPYFTKVQNWESRDHRNLKAKWSVLKIFLGQNMLNNLKTNENCGSLKFSVQKTLFLFILNTIPEQSPKQSFFDGDTI